MNEPRKNKDLKIEKAILKKHLLKTPIGNWVKDIWPSFRDTLGKKYEEIPEKELKKDFDNVSKNVSREINTKGFKPIHSQELSDILGLTIKKDKENKIITFLCQLSAYSEDSQFNISYNAPSSVGKSYISLEVSALFPKEDVLEIGYCSPTAFFHDVGKPDPKQPGFILIDLSKKILIFLDQPHPQLLERMRPVLSHDKKEINIKITDKSQKQGLRTKNVVIKGFPAVIFCTAGLRIDEQEATRFLLLSPETSKIKITEAIREKIDKETDKETYRSKLHKNPERKLLKERIIAIKQEGIKDIKIKSPSKIKEKFFRENKKLKPRHSRDIGRIISLIKTFALLNLWWRKREGSSITANDADIEEAFKIWRKISKSQELNIPPYLYNIYKEVIVPAYEDAGSQLGLTRQKVLKKYQEVNDRYLDITQFRQQMLPMLETSGLIIQEPDPNDKRKMLIYPNLIDKKNSESRGGVNPQIDDFNILKNEL